MKLTPHALQRLDNLNVRLALALKLQFSETWIRSLIIKNKDNGPLTTAVALKVIQNETGLSESEILTESVNQISSTKIVTV